MTKLEQTELALKEMRQEYDDLADAFEIMQDAYKAIYTFAVINNIKLDYEGELH